MRMFPEARLSLLSSCDGVVGRLPEPVLDNSQMWHLSFKNVLTLVRHEHMFSRSMPLDDDLFSVAIKPPVHLALNELDNVSCCPNRTLRSRRFWESNLSQP